MSRRYQTVQTSMYDDKKVRALDEDSRNVFIYLLICKHANLPGLFLLPMSYITRDIQYGSDRVQEAFKNLSERRFIEYDYASETIFVRTWLRHKPLDNPNKVKGALAALDEIPDSPLFSRLLTFLEDEKPNGFETLSEALRKRIETLSKEVTVTVPVTVEVTVPVLKESKSEKTALAPKEPPKYDDSSKEDEKPRKSQKSVKSPACHAYRDIFHLWPNRTQEEEIDRHVISEDAVAAWSNVCRTWAMRGNKPTGIEGMLDWFVKGIPEKPNGDNSKGGGKVSRTMRTLADRMQEHMKEREEARIHGKQD